MRRSAAASVTRSDAAYAMPAHCGQGANTTIEGAVTLADLLAGTASGERDVVPGRRAGALPGPAGRAQHIFGKTAESRAS